VAAVVPTVRPHSTGALLRILVTLMTLATLFAFVENAGAATNVSKWSTPIRVDPGGTANNQTAYSVSCPTTAFCLVTGGNGHVVYRRSGNWSSPQAVQAGGTFDSVSCRSATFCVAVTSGQAVTYNGHSWSKAQKVGPEATYKISCPTTSFCAAVGASGMLGKPSTIATFNGHSWSSKQTSTTGTLDDRLMDVSCATSTFCVAVNFDGQILTFNGAKWAPSRVTGPKGLISVSCATQEFCMAMTDSGLSITFHGKGWSPSAIIPKFASAFAYSVSCASSTACVAIGLTGAAISWNAGRWSKPVTVFPGEPVAGVAVACSPSNVCVAVNDQGRSSVS
jgi:hypothetical protein